VKRMTRTGKPVQVTDNGRPLWVIQPAIVEESPAQRRREMEAELAAVLQGPKSRMALSDLILESRR